MRLSVLLALTFLLTACATLYNPGKTPAQYERDKSGCIGQVANVRNALLPLWFMKADYNDCMMRLGWYPK